MWDHGCRGDSHTGVGEESHVWERVCLGGRASHGETVVWGSARDQMSYEDW